VHLARQSARALRARTHGSFKHPEAWLAAFILTLPDQALGDKRFQASQDIEVAVQVAHGVGSLQGPATHKDREAAKQAALAIVQEIVTPGDRAAQRLLPSRKISRSADKQRESML